MCKPIDLMQLFPYFRATLLVSEQAQQQFDFPVMEELNPDQRLRVGPVVVGELRNVAQKIFVCLAKRLAEPQRGIPGLPFERAYLRVALNVLGQQQIDHRLCLPFQRKKAFEPADLGLAISDEPRDRLANRLLRLDWVGLYGMEKSLARHPFDRVVVAL
jgi:hypothetical protein